MMKHLPLVLDGGSGTCKVGFAGDKNPCVMMPSIVGHPKYAAMIPGMATKQVYIGDAAMSQRGRLTLRHPVQRGLIQDWDDMGCLWNVLFDSTRAATNERPILVADPALTPRRERERIMQILFETFYTPSFYAVNQGLLALLASGSYTGISVESGDGVFQAVPVYEGNIITEAIQRLDLAGCDVTDYLIKILRKTRKYDFATTAEREIARAIKEKLAYVSLDFPKISKDSISANSDSRISENSLSANSCDESIYELPDGQFVTLGSERFRCAEALFRPRELLRRTDARGIHAATHDAIAQCVDGSVRAAMYRNVVLSGGNMMIPGMEERMRNELNFLAPNNTEVQIKTEKDNAVWRGGSLIASLSSFTNLFIPAAEYNEVGPSILNRMCI